MLDFKFYQRKKVYDMNGDSILNKIAAELDKVKLEVIMIGNAAAALHGAPVTTLDIDFMFRENPANLQKLKRLAKNIGGIILRPYYPVSSLYRLVSDNSGIQLDFMSKVHGVKSFPGLRSRSTKINFGKNSLLIASLDDIISSKQAAARERDLAVLPVLKRTKNELEKKTTR
jgi:hypothetical protein